MRTAACWASGLSARMHDDRAAAQQPGGLQFGGHVVAVEVVHQAQVEAALQDAAVDLGLLGADHLDLGQRVTLPELLDGRGEQRRRGRADRAQPDQPDAAVLLAGRVPEPVERVEQGQDVGKQLAAGVAHPRPVPAPVEQVDAEFAFQAPDRAAQRGLGDVQLVCGAPKRAQPGHRGHVFKLLDPHTTPLARRQSTPG